MRVYISADIEGITGLVTWSQCGRPSGDHYDFKFAREMMTHDVNAAIRACRSVGADDIVIKDSHGNSKNLLVSDLEPGVTLVTGTGSLNDGMMIGVDSTFDAALLIGYHAMAGTLHGIMEHTISGQVHRLWFNGMPAGEIAMSAGIAGHYGVPIVAISSDAAGCREARALLGEDIGTAAVKDGFGRYMGRVSHPNETGPMIERAVRAGLENRALIRPWLPTPPVAVRIEFNRSEEADVAGRGIGMVRLDAFTLEYVAPSYHEAHQAARQMIAMASLGAGNG